VPGFDIQYFDEDGKLRPDGEVGNLVIKLPMPPGTFYTLWHDNKRFEDSYLARYPGYYLSGDAGFRDKDGYCSVMTRIDDIINVAGHRLSTGQMEQVLAAHPDVAEGAVVGVADPIKGQVPLGLVVLKSGVTRSEADICEELVASMRNEIGPVASFKSVKVVKRLPKTRSGKVLRVTIRTMADGVEARVPATIEDASVLPEITEALSQLGYPQAPAMM
jgi:propionyl-CoA synthetase